MMRTRIAAFIGAAALGLALLTGCDGDDASEASPPPTTTTAAKADTGPSLQELRKSFKTDWGTPGMEVSWWPYVDRIEGVVGGWLYIETKIHPDNPDAGEVGQSICSAGLGLGNAADTRIEGFRGVSVFGVGSSKIAECTP